MRGGRPVRQVSANKSQCPACGADSAGRGSSIIVCDRCGHAWLKRSREDHAAVESTTFTRDYAGYRPDPKYLESTERVIRTELLPRVKPPARLLDVGCGAGDLMSVAGPLGYDAEGIDISEASAEICRSRNLTAVAADFLTWDPSGSFDLIVMWDVIAHLREPAAFFERAHSLLSNRGVLFIKTPAIGKLSVRLAERWPRFAGAILGAPSHSQYFNRKSLSALMSRTGFEPEWISGGEARSARTGGSLKRRLARGVRAAVKRLSGDGNLYVAARPTA